MTDRIDRDPYAVNQAGVDVTEATVSMGSVGDFEYAVTDENVDLIAKTCHELNRIWCGMNGDHSQPSWESAPDWQTKSAKTGVLFHAKNPHAGDSATHDSWMEEKVADGWVYGPVKDPIKKEHHCMVPFEMLPPDQQAKDALFRSTCHALFKHYALKI